MKTDKRITSFDDHLNQQYGKKGTTEREKFEEDFETFRIGALIQEARKKTTTYPTATCRESRDNQKLHLKNREQRE